MAATLYYLALYYLALYYLAYSFGIRKSTVSKIIRRVTQAISKYLKVNILFLPTNKKDIEEMASNFYNSHSFSQCICAVDGTYVGVKITLSVGKENTH